MQVMMMESVNLPPTLMAVTGVSTANPPPAILEPCFWSMDLSSSKVLMAEKLMCES